MSPESPNDKLAPSELAATAASPTATADEPLATVSLHLDAGAADETAAFVRPPAVAAQPSPGAAHPASPATAFDFGDYEILGEIARGGMGVVYKARQKGLNRTVALKMILAGRLASDQDVKRFYAEAEAAAALEHPGIVPIYEIGERAGQHFFSMAFVEGRSLQAVIKEGPLPAAQAAELVQQVALAVAYAHAKGIVHRDLKPHNILLDADGRPKVTDFGLAKRMNDEQGLTSTGDILGTPSYMAPEQAQGKLDEIGPLSDVYALGAILYAALTGRPPIQAATLPETLRQVVEQEPAPPRLLIAAIPRDLETICLKALHKPPGRRYASAEELADDLARFLRGETIRARPASQLERLSRWAWRHPAAAALALVSAVALLLTVGLSQYFTYRLAVANGQTQLREQERQAEFERRQAAEQQREAAEELAGTQQYYAKLMAARDAIARQEQGWPSAALELVEEAAALRTPARNSADLRTTAAACLRGIELRPAGQIAEGYDSALLAFHPQQPQLALAEGRPRGLSQFSLRVRIVEFPSGKVLRELSYPTNVLEFARTGKIDRPVRLAWSPDGRWLALLSRLGTAHLFDLNAAAPQPQSIKLGSYEQGVYLAFGGDSEAIFTAGGAPPVVKRWRLRPTLQAVAEREYPQIDGLAVSPATGEVVLVGNHKLRTLAPETLEELRTVEVITRGPVEFDPRGQVLLVSREGRLDWRDPASNATRGPLRGKRDADLAGRGIEAIRWSRDGSLIVYQSHASPRTLEFWDAVSGENFAEWPIPDGAGFAEFDPSGRWVAVCREFAVQVLEVQRSPEYRTAAVHYGELLAAGLAPHGDRLLTVAEFDYPQQPAAVAAWDIRDGRSALQAPLRRIGFARHFDRRTAVAHHPLAPEWVVAAARATVLEAISAETHQALWRRELPGPRSVAYAQPTRQLWAAQDNQVLAARRAGDSAADWLTWRNPLAAVSGGDNIACIAAAGEWVAAGGGDGSVHVFSAALPTTAAEFQPAWSKLLARGKALRALGFSADAAVLFAGDEAGRWYRVRLSDRTWNEHPAHKQAMTALCVLPSGVLITGSSDRSIRFWRWNQAQPEELFELPASGAVVQLSTSADGAKLAVVIAGERGVQLWDLAALERRFAGLQAPYLLSPGQVP